MSGPVAVAENRLGKLELTALALYVMLLAVVTWGELTDSAALKRLLGALF